MVVQCPNKRKYQVSKLKKKNSCCFETKHTGIFLSPLGYDKLLERGTSKSDVNGSLCILDKANGMGILPFIKKNGTML